MSKLKAQRRVTQMTANSAQFLSSNIAAIMRNLDQASGEHLQSILKVIIKTITLNDDTVALRMFVDPAVEEIICTLPKTILKNTNGPVENHVAMGMDAEKGLSERPQWWAMQDSNLPPSD